MNRNAVLLVLALALSALPAPAQSQVATYYGSAPGDLHSVVLGGEDLDGDGYDDLVVGAPYDSKFSSAGAVYAYSGKTGALLWSQFGSSSNDEFGTALAFGGYLDGDFVKEVVVGAPNAAVIPSLRPGHVQVLSGADGSVLYTGWGDDHNERMGTSVAGQFHWNTASAMDFAGGAPSDDDGGAEAGEALRVWSGDTGGHLATVHGAAGDRLGWSLSGVEDVNNDGNFDLAVGAPFADFILADVGEVRVYGQNGTVLWTKWGLATGDQTGWSVAPAGDITSDNHADVLVGEPGNADNGVDAGRVRAFSGANAFQIFQLRGDGFGDRFGSSLALVHDLDGDFHSDWAIGAPQPVLGTGYARIFSADLGTELFTLEGDAVGDQFGSSVSNGGIPQPTVPAGIAVGAMRHDGPAGVDTGMSRLYTGSCPGLVSYCTTGISASGCQPVLTAGGAPSATASSGFIVAAYPVEGAKDGLFFFGWNGRQAAQWGNSSSYQCVAPPVKRGGVIAKQGGHGTCTGFFQQDLNQLWSSAPAKNPGAGAVVQLQLWYRDPTNTSNQTTSLSGAIEFVMCP